MTRDQPEPNQGVGSDIVKPLEDAKLPRRREPQRRDVRAEDGGKLPRLPHAEKPEE